MRESFERTKSPEIKRKPLLDFKDILFGINFNLKLEKESNPVSFSYDRNKKSLEVGINQDVALKKMKEILKGEFKENPVQNTGDKYQEYMASLISRFNEESLGVILGWLNNNFEPRERQILIKEMHSLEPEQVMKLCRLTADEARIIFNIKKPKPSFFDGVGKVLRERAVNYLNKKQNI